MDNELINSFLDKSEEAFLMAIEIYNKPTIKYRLEGFAFFICNAWELLLKAKMLKNGESIYYPDKPNRTISLSNCVSHIFTNDKDPVRKNLEIIISLRNTSTHFVIKEMDSIYLPFMQANVLNYSQKLFDFFERDITEKINSSFMTLVINNESISDEEILSRYGDNILTRYNKVKNETEQIITENSNEKLAIQIDLNVKIVKDKDEAKTTFRIAKDGEEPVRIIKEIKDTNLTHCYKQKRIREIVEDNLKRKGINIKINQYDLGLLCDKFDLKDNEKYYYKHALTNSWGCSQQLVDFLTELFIKNPNIINELKEEKSENKENKA
ncbi:MAG: DUF3644 domain-containing protein [Bacilli bacterium]|nr:DUF3644 domain-containing protein [Bacilli bacterium]